MPLDIAIGILFGLGIPAAFGEPVSLVMVFIGVAFALLPDLDAVLEFIIRKGKVSGTSQTIHREWLHYPLTYIPLAVLIYLLAGPVWGVLFAACITAHFLHDSIGIGWGIKWLAPFTQNAYKLFVTDPDTSRFHVIKTWQPKELAKVIKTHGDPDWIRNIYLRPSPTLIIETLCLLAGVITLVAILAR